MPPFAFTLGIRVRVLKSVLSIPTIVSTVPRYINITVSVNIRVFPSISPTLPHIPINRFIITIAYNVIITVVVIVATGFHRSMRWRVSYVWLNYRILGTNCSPTFIDISRAHYKYLCFYFRVESERAWRIV